MQVWNLGYNVWICADTYTLHCHSKSVMKLIVCELITQLCEISQNRFVSVTYELCQCDLWPSIIYACRNIEDLTQQVNKLDLKLNDLMEENEELRSRLGLDATQPIDMDQARLTRGLQHQQDRALNQVNKLLNIHKACILLELGLLRNQDTKTRPHKGRSV